MPRGRADYSYCKCPWPKMLTNTRPQKRKKFYKIRGTSRKVFKREK
jgi:hypothetical protein